MARQVTGKNDNATARGEFLKILNNSDMFFNNVSFPLHESDKKAFKLCSSAEKAKKHCPNRWQAIQQWFRETREVIDTHVVYINNAALALKACRVSESFESEASDGKENMLVAFVA